MWNKFRTFADIKSNIKGAGMRSTAKDIMDLYQSSNKDEIAEYFPLLMNERLNCIFQKSVEPKTADYQEVADMLNGVIELNIEAGHVKVLLDFYPYVKAKIAHNPANDEMMRDLILDAVSDFFLGCPWPEYEENINMDNYLDALTVQFKGFSTGFEIMSQIIVDQHQNAQEIKAGVSSNDDLSNMNEQDTVSALTSAYAENDYDDEDRIILSKKTYKEINEYYLGLDGEDMLPPEEIDKILVDSPIKSQIVEWGFDTVVRENLFEILIDYFVPHDHTLSYEEKNQKMLDAVKEYSRDFKEKNKKDLQS